DTPASRIRASPPAATTHQTRRSQRWVSRKFAQWPSDDRQSRPTPEGECTSSIPVPRCADPPQAEPWPLQPPRFLSVDERTILSEEFHPSTSRALRPRTRTTRAPSNQRWYTTHSTASAGRAAASRASD